MRGGEVLSKYGVWVVGVELDMFDIPNDRLDWEPLWVEGLMENDLALFVNFLSLLDILSVAKM